MAVNLIPWLRGRRNGSRRAQGQPRLPDLFEGGPKTLMAIMAHPDDIDFTSAGTIAKCCAAGWTVYYVLATSGDKGTHEDLTRQELAAMREQEQREAAAALGVKEVIFLGYPDGFLEATTELRGQIVRLLRKHQVDVVLTWDGFRRGFNHMDHRNIGIATRDALYPAVRDHLYYEEHLAEDLAARPVNELLLAGADDPDYFVDVSDFIEAKVDAILCHRSQVSTRDRDEMLKNHRERGRRAGQRGNWESFKRVRIGRPPRQQRQEPASSTQAEPAPAGASQSRT
jgi:LmbE family N-acetylglucosaminyl deacetylase